MFLDELPPFDVEKFLAENDKGADGNPACTPLFNKFNVIEFIENHHLTLLEGTTDDGERTGYLDDLAFDLADSLNAIIRYYMDKSKG